MYLSAEEFLIRAGLSSHYKGFKYLAHAIKLVREDDSWLINVTKKLYPELARIYDSNWVTVERDMRILVEKAWNKNAPELLKKIGYQSDYKPYTREFIFFGSIFPKDFDKDGQK